MLISYIPSQIMENIHAEEFLYLAAIIERKYCQTGVPKSRLPADASATSMCASACLTGATNSSVYEHRPGIRTADAVSFEEM